LFQDRHAREGSADVFPLEEMGTENSVVLKPVSFSAWGICRAGGDLRGRLSTPLRFLGELMICGTFTVIVGICGQQRVVGCPV
jgi:hypothetical protein